MRFIFAFLLLITPALSHEWWGNGKEVDPITRQNCCGKSDCKVLDEKTLKRKVTKYGIELEFPNPVPPANGLKHLWKPVIKDIISHKRVQPSPDGKYWACISPINKIYCYWEPNRGS